MIVHKELTQIVKLLDLLNKEVEKIENKTDTDMINFMSARFIKNCVEEGGHLYDYNGNKLDNNGLVDDEYYCKQHRGFMADDYHGTLYYATVDPGTFIAVDFSTY